MRGEYGKEARRQRQTRTLSHLLIEEKVIDAID